MEDASNGDIRIIIDPVVTDELIDKENDEMEMDIDEEKSSVQRLRNGGIVISYNDIANIYETILPYPQEERRGHDWVNSENLAEIP